MRKFDLWTDGGARGNPGPAAIGVVIAEHGRELDAFGRTIGTTTNNRAEYAALVAGLTRAQELGGTHLTCHLDSELVVAQLTGRYRTKDAGMRHAAAAVQSLARAFTQVTYVAVPREQNRTADRLVNRALDGRLSSSP
jgi:ribonuclease HI